MPSRSALDSTNVGSPLDSIPSRTQTFTLPESPGHSTYEPTIAKHLSGSFGTVPTFEDSGTASTDSMDSSFDDLWPQSQSQSLIQSRSLLQPPPVLRDVTNRGSPETTSAINELGLVMKILCRKLPRSINVNASMRASYFSYIFSEYELQRVRKFFQPPPISMRDTLVARIVRSGANLWFLYLGAKIFEQLNKSPRHAMVQPFVHWINRCDEQVTNSLNPNCLVEELESRLWGLLELILLKFVAVNTQAGYSLFYRSVPVFIGLVSSDPTLLVERYGLLLISIPRAIETPRYEIRRFVFYDTMIAFALGTPPLVQYDASDYPIVPAAVRPLEWVHGIPEELIVNLVQINSWRASNPGIPNANDWPELELRALAWIPRTTELMGEDLSEDSYKVVSRMAVQETWRHTVLIYIYMGMCLVDSHDPRVQHSVRQILQLMDVLSGSQLDVHLFLSYLVAGVAARYEKQRAAVRDKIDSFFGTRVWLLPGAEFTRVLDHLWHGVAAGGAPVTWDDYVYSRCTVLPVA